MNQTCWQMNSRLMNVINVFTLKTLQITRSLFVCIIGDMLIISRDTNDINATKCILESKLDMKDLGVADAILGIRILRTP